MLRLWSVESLVGAFGTDAVLVASCCSGFFHGGLCILVSVGCENFVRSRGDFKFQFHEV